MSRLLNAIPVLRSLDVHASLAFFHDKLGFETWTWDDAGAYGGIQRDGVEIHFSKTDNQIVSDSPACRVDVDDVQSLYDQARAANCLHPDGDLADKPWGYREFSILDPNGLTITFGKNIE
jgi:catechol 2,3-dioxygenase-like lactoylglutathione lyase family enzyme